MSNIGPEGRSYQTIALDDLKRLLEIAKRDWDIFFNSYPIWKKYYAQRMLCVALCQGAASHYLYGNVGINDFDIYTFYKKHPQKTWYAKRIKVYDLNYPKFGRSVDKPNFVGRRVDCLSRSIDVQRSEEPKSALRRYLTEGKTKTAKLLSEKAVALLEPDCGKIIWPIQN